MSTKINLTTLAEVKTVLGITGSGEDTELARYILAAQRLFENAIGADRLDRRTINDEIVNDMPGKSYFYVEQIPFHRLVRFADFDDTVLETHKTLTVRKFGTEYSRKIYTKPSVIVEQAVELPFTITYVAGYAPFNQLDLSDYEAFTTGDTVTFEGATVTEGTDFTAATSEENTATLIYNALVAAGATAASLEVDGTIIRQLATEDSGVALTATFADSDAGEVISADVPEDIKMVISWIVGGMRKMKTKIGGLQSYTLGSKTVSYIDGTDKNKTSEAEMIIDTYASRYANMIALGA